MHILTSVDGKDVPGEEAAHLEVLPGASRSSHRVDRDRSEAAKGASGGGLCSYCLSSALDIETGTLPTLLAIVTGL